MPSKCTTTSRVSSKAESSIAGFTRNPIAYDRCGAKNDIVPFEKPDDAIHLAFATAYRVQFLCTWNFKHLANALVLQRLRNLNEKHGIVTPQVCTPEELLGE